MLVLKRSVINGSGDEITRTDFLHETAGFHTDYEILKKRATQGEIRRSKGLSITRFAKKYKA